MAVLSLHLSIIILTVNGLNSPTKRNRVAGWIEKKKKKDPTICCFQNTHRSSKDKHRANTEGMEDNTPSKFSQKKVGITILISDKIDFKAKKVTKDKNGQYIMIKGKIHQEDITVINIYAPKMGARKYIK